MLSMARAVLFRHKNRFRQHFSLMLEKRQIPIFSCQTSKRLADGRRRHCFKISLFLFSTLIAWRRFWGFIFSVCMFLLEFFLFLLS